MGQNSCQPKGLQPESALASLLVLAIERLLPSPGVLPSPILAATHTCFIMLGTLCLCLIIEYRLLMCAAGRDSLICVSAACGCLIGRGAAQAAPGIRIPIITNA